MAHLYLLQYTCLLSSIFMTLMLCISRFQQNHTTRVYEQARWIQVTAMVLLIIHYALQMHFRIRASSPDWGMMVNVLFYAPAAYLLSCSILQMDSERKHFARHALTGGVGCLLIPLTFGIGLLKHRGADMPLAQDIMHLLFVALMLYCIVVPLLSIRRSLRRVVDETAGEIHAYVKYAQASYVILCALSLALVFAIVWTPMLYVVGPLMLLSLFVYVMSFVAVGYNLAPLEDVLREGETNNDKAPQEGDAAAPAVTQTARSATGRVSHLTEERAETIRQLIEAWLGNGGFRESTVNMVTLSRQIKVARTDISAYFECHLHTTFRVWLSDIRLKEAQRLMMEHPEYGNDAISTSCGFSSRSQLYRIFSDKLGMTPGEWRDRQCQKQGGLEA